MNKRSVDLQQYYTCQVSQIITVTTLNYSILIYITFVIILIVLYFLDQAFPNCQIKIQYDIQILRETKQRKKYLLFIDLNNPQKQDVECLSQKRWPIQCYYIEKNSSRNFCIPASPAMVLVLSKLIGNQTKKQNRFINANDTLLNFKLLISHS